MSRHRGGFAAGLVALAVIALAAACGDSAGPLSPFQPEIRNMPDMFEFQATGVTNVTWTYMYTWSNSGDSASVDEATTVTGGSATLTISDNNGTQLYSQPISNRGTVGMPKGVRGNWTIKVEFSNYSGTVNFRVQKKP